MPDQLPNPLRRGCPANLSFEWLLDGDEVATLLMIHPNTRQKMARNGVDRCADRKTVALLRLGSERLT